MTVQSPKQFVLSILYAMRRDLAVALVRIGSSEYAPIIRAQYDAVEKRITQLE